MQSVDAPDLLDIRSALVIPKFLKWTAYVGANARVYCPVESPNPTKRLLRT